MKNNNKKNINYEIKQANNSSKFINNKLWAHLHCYDIDKFDEIYGEYIEDIMKYFSVTVTYSKGSNIPNLNFTVLKYSTYKNLAVIDYLNNTNIQLDYLITNISCELNLNKITLIMNLISQNYNKQIFFIPNYEFNIIKFKNNQEYYVYKKQINDKLDYKKNLLIDYHIYNRDQFEVYNLGYMIESFFENNLYCDIFLTFILPKNNKDELIIKYLKNKYSHYNCNILVTYRENAGTDCKTIFNTLNICKLNSLNYDWFYHTHTKTIRHVAIDNFVFFNNLDLSMKMVEHLYQYIDTISIFGSGYDAIPNFLEFNKGKSLINCITYLKYIGYTDFKLKDYLNSCFFGGNIWICNFKKIINILNVINIDIIMNSMKDPEKEIDYYWVDFLINKSNNHINRNLIEKITNYLPCGNCYSTQSLVNNGWRDNSVMNIIERILPFILSQYGEVHVYGRQEYGFNEEIYRKKYSDLKNLSKTTLLKHSKKNAFVEGRKKNHFIFDGFYEVIIQFPYDDYIRNIHNKHNIPIKNIKEKLDDLNDMIYDFNGEINTHPCINKIINFCGPYAKTSDEFQHKVFNNLSKHKKINISTNENLLSHNLNLKNELNFSFIINKLDTCILTDIKNCGDIIYDYILENKTLETKIILDDNYYQIVYNFNFIKHVLKNNKKCEGLQIIDNEIVDVIMRDKHKFMTDNVDILNYYYKIIVSKFSNYDTYRLYNPDLTHLSDKECENHIITTYHKELRHGLAITKSDYINYINELKINSEIKDLLNTILDINYNPNIRLPDMSSPLFQEIFHKKNFLYFRLSFKDENKKYNLFNLIK